MDINRRTLLAGSASLALTELAGSGPARSVALDLTELRGALHWHPFVRSLLCRARLAQGPADKAGVERIVRDVAAARTGAKPLVIKWLADPSCAFEHLSEYGLDRLLEMNVTGLWRRAGRSYSVDDPTRNSWRRVPREVLADIFRVEEHDRALMAPKLRAKSRAVTEGASAEAVFRVRAVAAQIGWLEACIPIMAAQAVATVEGLLLTGQPEDSEQIRHQLMVFDAYELGLLATWETPDAIIYVPRTSVI